MNCRSICLVQHIWRALTRLIRCRPTQRSRIDVAHLFCMHVAYIYICYILCVWPSICILLLIAIHVSIIAIITYC